ncbi:MAG: LLM class flavin-dependent oxidoreductase [Actinobacteria bacterium]|nr:LLM class flavin-dependent oxidoreductase [Actinomycetota bacterium]
MPAVRPRLRFGVFLAPFHEPGQNPTLCLERDLDVIVHLDRLGFDEAWVGEHHSTGWELVASPEIFLAVAAERTRHIRLGTGVVSLPYHHPLMVADRIVLLDHLTRGRVNFGVGPGGHLTDAAMLGIDPMLLRPRMAEALEVIVRLFTERTPISVDSDWFTLREAVLQLAPHQSPHPPIAITSMESPAGMELAGRFGAGVLSLSVARGPGGPIDLARQWRIAEEAADRHGRRVSRSEWRLAVTMHVAESRAEAVADVRAAAGRHVFGYVEGVTGRPSAVPGPSDLVVDQMMELGAWAIGTPDDAIAAIERLIERSGGFGGVLIWGNEWAPWASVLRSYELIARHVIPHFDGSLVSIEASHAVARSRARDGLNAARMAAVEAAQRDYDMRAAADVTAPGGAERGN